MLSLPRDLGKQARQRLKLRIICIFREIFLKRLITGLLKEGNFKGLQSDRFADCGYRFSATLNRHLRPFLSAYLRGSQPPSELHLDY